jgi:hypothetical protein
MEKKMVERLLKDARLEFLLEKKPIPSNTFLKAHFDGLMLVMPTVILVSGLRKLCFFLPEVIFYPFYPRIVNFREIFMHCFLRTLTENRFSVGKMY